MVYQNNETVTVSIFPILTWLEWSFVGASLPKQRNFNGSSLIATFRGSYTITVFRADMASIYSLLIFICIHMPILGHLLLVLLLFAQYAMSNSSVPVLPSERVTEHTEVSNLL